MTFAAADPVSSGCPYPILEVSGREPAQIDDFAGSDITITLGSGQDQHMVTGDGARHGEDIRFYQKDCEGGKDIRVWQITVNQTGLGFSAVTPAAHL